MAFVSSTLLCSIVALFVLADANVFLSPSLPHIDLNSDSLLEELERVLSSVDRDQIASRGNALEDRLRSTFLSLPQDEAGRLEPAAVRYLLHRYFVDRHGWYVLGFDTQGEAWNSSSATAALGQNVGSDAQEAFENRVESHGLTLHEVALLAVTLESFVHMETVQRLHSSYRVLGLSHKEDTPKEFDVVHAIDTYMLMLVLGLNHSSVTPAEIELQWRDINELYPTWPETRRWIREVRKEVVSSHPEARTTFDTTVKVVESISDQYGRWQDKECIDLKDLMLKYETPGTGRVSLARFYEAAVNGVWQFSEHKGYLQQIGSLDETDVNRPSVVISNYINSPANCVAASKFYNVCCINECESLLAHLEREIAAPQTSPELIIQVIENLPSSSVEAPRKLNDDVLARLYEIAALHGGVVPLHARLFNQWLHHVYPLECPYPHLSGTSKPVSPEKWMEVSGENVEVDADTMRWHIEQYKAFDSEEQSGELPWCSEEELFFTRPGLHGASSPSVLGSLARGAMFIAIVCSMSVSLMRMISSVGSVSRAIPQEKVLV